MLLLWLLRTDMFLMQDSMREHYMPPDGTYQCWVNLCLRSAVQLKPLEARQSMPCVTCTHLSKRPDADSAPTEQIHSESSDKQHSLVQQTAYLARGYAVRKACASLPFSPTLTAVITVTSQLGCRAYGRWLYHTTITQLAYLGLQLDEAHVHQCSSLPFTIWFLVISSLTC